MTIPESPPDVKKIIDRIATLIGNPRSLGHFIGALLVDFKEVNPAPSGRYRHWDTLRRLTPPERLTSEAWWLGIKLARLQMSRSTPLKDHGGRPFWYALPDPLLAMLHRVDREASGRLPVPEPMTNLQTRERYIQNALVEEAFASSALDGAVSTREDAKAIIRTGRRPIDRSERMILNTFRALHLIRDRKDEELTPALLLHLHRTITDGTLEETARSLRRPGDRREGYEAVHTLSLHSPPPAEDVAARMKTLCRFANEGTSEGFLHPVLRALILHFWLAYDHPFVDGNGRTARALFYWSMLSQGFGFAAYVSISSILRNAPARYRKSFWYTETDDNDLTYFLLAQLRAICRAFDDVQTYGARKARDARETADLLPPSVALNPRQLALLSHALRHPTQRYTIAAHRMSHQVTYQTARTDMLELADRKLLEKQKRSRAFVFVPAPDLRERMQHLK